MNEKKKKLSMNSGCHKTRETNGRNLNEKKVGSINMSPRRDRVKALHVNLTVFLS